MKINKKENIFILHSLNGDTINIWGQDIKENFSKQNIKVFLPEFPIRADSTYEKFQDILKVYLDNKTLNQNSIVICHSIGNAYFIRFCKEMNYVPKAYIAVAPGAVYNIPSNRNDYIVKVKAQAYCKQEQLDFIKENLDIKYCLYSDEDEPKEKMFKKFIEDTNSIGMYLKYYNHFDGYHRIYKIPELTELINKILYQKNNNIDKSKYEKWTKEFMESWKELDWKRTLKTLSKDVEYYENPIDRPCSSFEEVTNLWNVVADNQKDIEYKFEIISFNEDTCIINWQMTRVMTKTNEKQEIDGIFQISLDNDGKCIYFKQWRFTR